jgi:hypothetical protein
VTKIVSALDIGPTGAAVTQPDARGPRYLRSQTALHRRMGTDVLVTTPTDPEVHQLSGGAVGVWEALDSPLALDELVARLAREHALGGARIAEQVRRCVEELARLGVLEECRDG